MDQTLAYGQILSTIASVGGTLAQELRDRSDRRAYHLLHLVTHGRSLFDALHQLREAFVWLADLPGLDPELTNLCQRCADSVVQGVESLVANPDPRAMDESRFLMEVEYLFRDFTRDPAQFGIWKGIADDWERFNKFSFGKCRDRAGRALGLPQNEALAVKAEYQVHSAAVHPRPLGPPVDVPPDQLDALLWDAGDLVQHSYNAFGAAMDAIHAIDEDDGTEAFADEDDGDEPSGVPEPPPMDVVHEVLEFMAAQHDYIERPASILKNEDLRATVTAHIRARHGGSE